VALEQTPRELQFRGALSPIPQGTQSAHFGGSPIDKFPVVTLWRPIRQMSVETILYKFLNEKGIIISTNVKDQR